MAEHSPLPWHVGRTNSGRLAVVSSQPATFGNRCPCTWDLPREKDFVDAEFICKAVNLHRELVDALLEVRNLVPSGSEAMHVIDEACNKAGVHPWKVK